MESFSMEEFLERAKLAGYDGIDSWVPESASERSELLRLLTQYEMVMVSHQHQASGATIDEFCRSMDYYLAISAEVDPLLINSHSGRDWFSLTEQLKVLDTAVEFENKTGVEVVHETHRGRIGFCPGNFKELAEQRSHIKITADLSHWTCVTESYLEGFTEILQHAIDRTRHIHARVGFTQGPQTPDPRKDEWSESFMKFSNWWTQIIQHRISSGAAQLTVTPEYGPFPYMLSKLANNESINLQWDINLFVKKWFRDNFSQ